MEPIKYVDELNNHYRSLGHPVYRWTVNSTAPLHRIDKPLAECTVALLTTGGISQCNMSPFNPNSYNDHRLDAIDKDTADDEFQIHDAYYNHDDADQDINCVFPISRLRELVDAGEVGRAADRHWSGFMGRIYNRTKVIEESAPAFVSKLNEDAVDILLAAPA